MAKKTYNLLIIIILTFSVSAKAADCLNASCLFVPNGVTQQDSSKPKITQQDTTKPDNKGKKTRINRVSNKRVTFATFDQHYERALKYYNNKQWLSAAGLFEELYPLSLGTPRADTILFLFADSYYQNGDYNMAAFHYRDYVKRYPNSEHTEEAFYHCITAIYKMSPEYYLDQTNTKYAIEQITTFLQAYPDNPHVEECNLMLDDLQLKLARKDLEILKLYYNTDHYEACQIAAKNFFNKYSYSPLMPEAIYYLVLNNLEYAKKSTERKKEARLKVCLESCEKMRINYPNSPYMKEVEKISQEVTRLLQKYKVKTS